MGLVCSRWLSFNVSLVNKSFSFVIDNRILLHDDDFLIKYNLTVTNRLRLQQLGLISGAESTLSITYGLSTVERYDLIALKKSIRLIPKQPDAKITINQCLLSSLGKEILSLTETEANMEYLKSIALYAHNNNFTATIYDYDRKTNILSNGIIVTP